MNFLLVPRVLAAFAIDASLALVVGLLLARLWMRGKEAFPLPTLRWPSLVLALALGVQVVLLTASFTGETSFGKLWAAMPDVLTTHPGRVAEITAGLALLLLGCTIIPLQPHIRLILEAVLTAILLALRSATGHAAVDGDFTLAELLQLAHLTAMALWSGGIMVSAYVLMRLYRARPSTLFIRDYLPRLSAVSTWSVATVALSGLLKSYRAIGGDPHLLLHNDWSLLLGVKLAVVACTVLLGGLNRLHLRKPAPWNRTENLRAVQLVTVEATAMFAVLVLSAWLANLAPPGE